MKLYLAYKDLVTLMDGRLEECRGVFDTAQKAWDYLETTQDFKKSSPAKDGQGRVYCFDGVSAYYWRVSEVTLNKGKRYE